MFFEKKLIVLKSEREIKLKKQVLDSILSYCHMKHPNEGILILRGKSKKGDILIDGLVIPPFAFNAHSSSGFPYHMLPVDMSYVGIVHSHPSGNANPSVTDLHNFFGLVSLIIRSPYDDDSIFAWDRNGNPVPLSIV